jgi:hypothetical protein
MTLRVRNLTRPRFRFVKSVLVTALSDRADVTLQKVYDPYILGAENDATIGA